MIKAFIFDVGGVLHTNESESIRQDIIDTLKIDHDIYDTAMESLLPDFGTGKMTEQDFWKKFLKLTGSTTMLPKVSLWEREYRKKFKVISEVIEIVKGLKDQGYKLAILSNTIDPHARINQKKGIFKLFDEIFLSHQVGLRKPDPAFYLLALRRLKVKPEEAVFIDDLDENVKAAEKLGILGILFENSHNLRKRLGEILNI